MGEEQIVVKIGEKEKTYPAGVSFLSIAQEYQEQYEDDIVLALYNNRLRELKKTIKKGKHFTLKVKLSSGSASHKLRFHSSHPGVAKVSLTGKVTARRRGSSTISVKTYNGHKAKLKLTVVK